MIIATVEDPCAIFMTEETPNASKIRATPEAPSPIWPRMASAMPADRIIAPNAPPAEVIKIMTPAAVSDRLIEHYHLVGPPERIAGRIEALRAAGATTV